jgi:predicted alpha/beta hydrolase family esterase
MPKGFISGAFLVAPADVDNAANWPAEDGATFDAVKSGFAPLPLGTLPFPSVLIASSTDPYCSLERAAALAKGWGSELVEAGDAGHINSVAGYGPWPDGALRFGAFLRTLES